MRQSFFHDDSRNFVDVGEGVTGIRGYHSSFRPTQGGLSLNMGTSFTSVLVNFCNAVLFTCLLMSLPSFIADVSTTMILKPGPVIDFLIANQNVREPRDIDWARVRNSPTSSLRFSIDFSITFQFSFDV